MFKFIDDMIFNATIKWWNKNTLVKHTNDILTKIDFPDIPKDLEEEMCDFYNADRWMLNEMAEKCDPDCLSIDNLIKVFNFDKKLLKNFKFEEVHGNAIIWIQKTDKEKKVLVKIYKRNNKKIKIKPQTKKIVNIANDLLSGTDAIMNSMGATSEIKKVELECLKR
jgi:hypothetical protein